MLKIILTTQLILIVVTGLFSPGPAKNEIPEITICHPGNFGEGMAQFVDDPAFIAAHPSPDPLQYNGLGERISFPTPDGKEASGYLIKAKQPTDKWLFVYQEWWGLNDYIRRESDTFYKDLGENINVLALDMYDGKVTDNPQQAGEYMRSASEDRLQNIIRGGLSFAGEDARIASVGWCFGGGWSLKSGLITGEHNIGVVMYYGMPVQDVDQLKTLNSDVLGLFATEEWISKDVIEEFAENMKEADKELDYKIYNAAHGFANPSNPRHDEEATRDAYVRALRYLKDKFSV